MLARRTAVETVQSLLGLAGRAGIRSSTSSRSIRGRDESSIGSVRGRGDRVLRAAVERLEDRRLFAFTTILSTGTDGGGLSVPVDAMGAFGFDRISQGTQYRDFGSAQKGVVSESYVYFAPLKTPLSNFRFINGTKPDGSEVDPLNGVQPEFDSVSGNTAVSSFTLSGTNAQNGQPFSLRIQLTQSLIGPIPTDLTRFSDYPAYKASRLTQTYRITNLLGTQSDFSLVRLLDARTPDTNTFSAPLQPFGAINAILDSGRTLLTVATDSSRQVINSDYLQVQSYGGTLDTSAVKPLGLKDRIAAANALTPALAGLDGSQNVYNFTTNSYVPSLAQQSTFSLAGRATTEYTTITTIGQGTPIQAIYSVTIPTTSLITGVPGQVTFNSGTYKWAFPRNADGTLQDLVLPLVRSGPDLPATSARVTLGFPPGTNLGTAPQGIVSILGTGLINFDVGQTTSSVTLRFNDLSQVPTDNSFFNLAVTSSVGAVTYLGGASVAIEPRVYDFSFTGTSQNYAFPKDPNGNLVPVQVTVERRTTSHGPATVSLASSGGTLPAGAVSGLPSTLTFADGQTQATATFNIDPALAGLNPSVLKLVIQSTTDSASYLVTPRELSLNVLPQSSVFQLASSSYTSAAGNPSLQVTINRSGNLNGSASVRFTTAAGTGNNPAQPGSEFTQTDQMVNFGDGQTSATVTVPLLGGRGDGVTRGFSVSLVGTNTPGSTPGIVGTTNAATVSFASPDVTGPSVTSVTTQGNNRGITGVLIKLSEPLRGVSVSAFQVAARSGEGLFGSARLSNVSIVAASYDPVANTVLLLPRSPLALNRQYQVTIRPNRGITDNTGNVLNATLSNRSGSAYTAIFSRGTRISYVDQVGNTVSLNMRQGSFELIRSSNGNGQSLNLFPIDAASTILFGNVRAPRGQEPVTNLGRINNLRDRFAPGSNTASATLVFPNGQFRYTSDLLTTPAPAQT